MLAALLKTWRSQGPGRGAAPARRAIPTQRSLDELLGRVTRIRVLGGGMRDYKGGSADVLADVWGAADLAAFRQCLVIVDDERSFGHCLCDGGPVLELHAGPGIAGVIAVHHGSSIRWSAWAYDALLEDGAQLLAWMAHVGAPGPLALHEDEQREAARVREAAASWTRAMPACLTPYWAQMEAAAGGIFQASFASIPRAGGAAPKPVEPTVAALAPLLHELDRTYPEIDDGILELLRWYGSGLGPWSGHPAYEDSAARLLGAYTTEQLVGALARNALTPAHREGAARFFCGYACRYRPDDVRRLPYTLRMLLLGHALRSLDADKRRRALAALSDSSGP